MKFDKNMSIKIMDPKSVFRLICSKYLELSRKVKLPIIEHGKLLEAVLVEFRILPHLELLVRNAIFKLGNDWSFTVVCGNSNYDFVKTFCENINRNVKIIKLDKTNIDVNQYNNMLLTLNFWKMFVGEKILIYQEDSFIFKSNIAEFLEYDYIGAPWKHRPVGIDVGNGGLSLRNKNVMLNILKNINPSKMPLDGTLRNAVANRGYDYPPEDVFFPKSMKDAKIGKVAPIAVAHRFSIEGIDHIDPFGGHQFWIASPRFWTLRLISSLELFTCQDYASPEGEFDANFMIKANSIKDAEILKNPKKYYNKKLNDVNFIYKTEQLNQKYQNLKIKLFSDKSIKIFHNNKIYNLNTFCDNFIYKKRNVKPLPRVTNISLQRTIKAR